MERIDVEKTASRGIAAAVAYKYLEPDWTPDMTLLAEEEVEAEQQRFAAVKGAVLQELGELAAENEIFAAHLEIADDFMLQEGITSKIRDEKKNAQLAVHEVVEEFAAVFAAMDDAYMK